MERHNCQRRVHAIVQTQRLAMCPLLTSDATAFEAVFCNPEVMKYSLGMKTQEWVREWISNIVENLYPAWGCGLWAVVEKQDCAVIGYCGLTRFPERCGPDEAELAFRLAQPFWGRGYATEAAGVVLDFGLQSMKFERIVAGVAPENTASIRVVEKIGMRYEGEILYQGYTYPDHHYVSTRVEPR